MSDHVPATFRTLAVCEQIIERGLKTFVEVGEALLEIRDGRLYREQYATFEDYCRERWGFERTRAHRLIEASQVAKMLPTGNTEMPMTHGDDRRHGLRDALHLAPDSSLLVGNHNQHRTAWLVISVFSRIRVGQLPLDLSPTNGRSA